MKSEEMGNDLSDYRCKIGIFAARVRPRRQRAKGEHYRAYAKWNVYTDFSARIMAFTFILCAWWSVRACAESVLTSDCAVSLVDAFTGAEHIVPRSSISESTTAIDLGYEFDHSFLLILGGQIELNPGPMERDEFEEIMKSWSEKIMKRVDLIAEDIQVVRQDINTLSCKIDGIEEEQLRLRAMISEQDNSIDLIAASQKESERRIQDLEAAIESQNIRERRDNVILYGVPETGTNDEDSVEQFTTVVNEVLQTPLRSSDITRAYRLGRSAAGKVRPLLARLARSSYKSTILQRRNELRDRGIGVSGDLTPRQRQEIQRAREQGLFAYFRGGVLHTEARRSRPASSRPLTRSYAKAAGGRDGR